MDKVYLVFVDGDNLELATNVKSKVIKFLSNKFEQSQYSIKLTIFENGEFSNEFECLDELNDEGYWVVNQRDLDEFKAMI